MLRTAVRLLLHTAYLTVPARRALVLAATCQSLSVTEDGKRAQFCVKSGSRRAVRIDAEAVVGRARELYRMALQEQDTDSKTSILDEAISMLNCAIDADQGQGELHKWMSVLLQERALCDGPLGPARAASAVKEHLEEAVKLNPNDGNLLHMLGAWCFHLAEEPWYRRKVAELLLDKPPPSATYEEALDHLLAAEREQPRLCSRNLLLLGLTYLRLGRRIQAVHYLQLAAACPEGTADDKEATEQARKQLAKIDNTMPDISISDLVG